MPPYIWMSKHMFGCPPVCSDDPICLDTPKFVWMPPVCLNDVWMPAVHIQHIESMLCQNKGFPYAPICLDAPCIFGCPHVCLEDVLCPLYIYNTKKACFVRLKGCPYAPYTFRCHHMFGHCNIFGHYPYVWMSLILLCTGGIQPYGGIPIFCIMLKYICHLEFPPSCFFIF